MFSGCYLTTQNDDLYALVHPGITGVVFDKIADLCIEARDKITAQLRDPADRLFVEREFSTLTDEVDRFVRDLFEPTQH